MKLERKDFLSTEDLSKEEIDLILETASFFKDVGERDIKKVPTLRGKTVINLFYEPSTRTRTSFEIAAKRMSADAINISASQSSTKKGETLKDTALNLASMNPDAIVLRHGVSMTPHMISKYLDCTVINAGDGAHEHPSQAMLDLMTICEHKKDKKNLKVSIIGDIKHSRVARSNIYALKTYGHEVTVCGPPTMMPLYIEDLGVNVTYDMMEAIKDADVIMMLRVQFERQEGNMFSTVREYSNLYGLNMDKLEYCKDDVLIMHPGPVNRGVEISPEVVDSDKSVVLDQVKNGLAVRMALFYLLIGGPRE